MSRLGRWIASTMLGTLAALFASAPAQAQGTIIASDNFNRANEVPFSTAGNWGRVVAGNFDGVCHLVNNEVTSVSNEGIYFWKGAGTFSSTRQFARQRVVQRDGELGLVLLGGPDHALMLQWGPPGVGTTLYVYWYSEGQDRGQLATFNSSVQNGDIIEAMLDGGVIYAKVNGTVVASVPNTTTLTTGTPGFITYLNPGLPTQIARLDDWEAGTPATYTISGTITENAAGLGGVTVTATGSFTGTTTTDGNGAYSFPSVPPNVTSITLTPTLSGHQMTPSNRTVTGPLAANVTGQDFTSELITNPTLTINAANGTVTKDPDLPSYSLGQVVTLTPTAHPTYDFGSWSGHVPVGDELDNPLQITMDQHRVITAHFLEEGVTAADGFNRADETPLTTGGNWEKVFPGTVNLSGNQAVAASGEALYYWNGPGTFDNARQFGRATVVSAGGQVGIALLAGPGRAIVAAWNGGQLFVYWYTGGSYQGQIANIATAPLQNGDQIEAVLDQGRIFVKRNGAVVHTVLNSTSLTTGTPGFETFQTGAAIDDWEAGTPPTFALSGTITENAAGLSGVTVTASGSFSGQTTTDVNGAYSFPSVPYGVTSVTITPTLSGHVMTPASRNVTGPLGGDVPGLDFTSSQNVGHVLTVNATNGTVAKNPDQPSYTPGTLVTLTPTANVGYSFNGWSGDVPVGDEQDNPLQVTMDQNRTINAHFLAQGLTASDDFNRANETPVSTSGNWGRVVAGNFDGVSHLVNNEITSVSQEGIYYWKGPGTFSPTRQFARERVVQKDGELGLVLLGGPDHALMLQWGPPGIGSTLYIYWYSDGLDRGQLGTFGSSVQNGDIIEAVLDGGIIYAKVNGTVVASIPNTTTLTTGTPGFITYLNPSLPTQVSRLDDWEAGTPPSYTISGTITENAAGLSGVTVTATGSFAGTTTTDANGAYSFADVPPNVASITLTPTLSGHQMSPTSRTVNGPLTGNVTGQNFTSTVVTDPTLTVHATHGTVIKNPDQSSYTLGQQVTLTPVPDANYTFNGWSGDVPPGDENDNPLQVTMDQSRVITAHFVAQGLAASDDFNRANETPLTVGGNWQKALAAGAANLSGNQVVGSTSDAVYYWNGPGAFSNTRQFARATVTSAGGQVGLVLLGGANQAYVVSWGGGRLFFYWYSGGAYQGELANVAATLQNGDEIEAILDQGRVFARVNGVVVHSMANTTSLTTGTPGFEMFQTGQAIDDWEAGTPPTVTISGTITESAVGLSGVTVTATGSFSGTTTTDGNGDYAFASVPYGVTSVTLTPTLTGYVFSPTNRTVTGPLNADVTGRDFAATASSGFLLTAGGTNGTVTKDPDQPAYAPGTLVTLTPIPNGGYSFAGWTGNVPPGDELDNPLQVTMDQDRVITAVFVAQGLTASDDFNRANETPLTVGGNWQQVLGGGSANLSGNQVVGATGEGAYFWNGAGAFTSRQFARATAVSAGGQIGIVLLGSPGNGLVVTWAGGRLIFYWYSGGAYQGELANVAAALANGDEIEAIVDQGRIFAKRNGVIVHSIANSTSLSTGKPGFELFQTGQALDNWQAGTPPTVTISGTITENALGVSGVTVTASGSFSGTTTTNGSGAYSFASVPFGVTSVTLTPTLSGYLFTPTNRTVNGPLNADVTNQDFTGVGTTEATLTVIATHGTVTKNPNLPVYPIGSNVTLTPVPDPGYHFASWSGDVPPGDENDNPLVLTMNQNRTVTAHFVPNDVAAWDDFNRANETPFAVGGNWIQPFGGGNSNLISQRVTGGAAEALYYWQGPGNFSTTRQFARSTVTQPGGQIGLVLLGSPGRAIVVAWNGGTLFIYWYTGGSYQGNLTTASSTLQVGDRIEALLENGVVYAKINGNIVTSVANTTTLPWGNPGFETFQTGQGFDDWEAGPTTADCSGQPDGTPCNDGDEVCTSNDTCQAGVCTGTTLSCDDGNVCTVDSCTPNVGCQSTPGNAGAVCRTAAGQCDAAETCTGDSSVCPADVFASASTTCTGTSQGGSCDAADHCSGTSNTCIDVYQPSTFECRPAIDACDVAESCSGTSGTCPTDNQSPELGTPCDGADSDLCNEGVKICVEGAIACSDTTSDDLDLCNGQDDDCDPSSPDGSEGPSIGVACDGPDSDLCNEGLGACVLGVFVCTDVTGNTVDLCNGVDDDCDPSSSDGSEDPGIGVACDGADTDLCNEGVTVCSGGAPTCSDTSGNNLDVCNGADDDCDPASADGAEDPGVGLACDGTDSDLCNEGVTLCTEGAIACTDTTGSTVDLCNGVDDDCDPASADGSEDPGVGVACDGDDGDLCMEGVTVCSGGTISCDDTTSDNLDVCNGADDDCDPASADGSEDPSLGAACDGTDGDLCNEGVTVCISGAPACNDTTSDNLDVCNGVDDDCDPASADGSEDPTLGVACDGTDGDLCNEGVTVCTAGAPTCNDATSDNLDVCNGADDDCDPASADGSEDPGVGVACDGTDSDLCNEGVTVCSDATISCNDTTSDNLDVCNGLDDDCDPASADGSEDPSLGAACDGTDGDLCNEGVTVCIGGVPTCNDTTSDNLDLCNGADDDCDPASADGSEDPGVGVACDGTDSDLCAEGVTVCSGGTISCNDATNDNLDVCNGVDDDCDPASADGSEDPSLGVACDGADGDLCNEGVTVCSGGAPTCNDTTSDNLDVCNGADDDCDPASADGSEDPGVGVACDGTDGDLCNEGVTVCSDATISCNDTTSDNLDVCNGADDDCDPASADGSEDPTLGVACDGADGDLCNEGVTICSGGAPACNDATSDNLDVCNGADDDCDPASADGSEDPGVGVACDGTDSDLCNEGVTVCSDATISCNDTTGSTLDLCNGADDDCDPASADGSEDPGVGVACDGDDSDLCLEGVTACSGGTISCTDTTGSTLDICNGADDDCDPASVDGSEDPTVGVACDGLDSDLCLEGTTVCSSGAVSCTDTTGSTVDVCNGLDDDCDPASADGAEDPGVGLACDGADSDLCVEGVTVCSGATISCNDTTGSTVDICNGVDDDCDPASVDGSEDPTVGVACDGPDSDLCIEGATVCASGTVSCTDTTGSTVDVCNGLNDDCDPASVDGSEDPLVGIACDGPDGDLCTEGISSCTAGAVACSDATGTAVESCNGLDDDCDGVTDENGIAMCDDGNSCNGQEVCGGVAGCQAGAPPAVSMVVSIPNGVTASPGGTIAVPILAQPSGGTTIELKLTYNTAHLQAVSVSPSLITAGSTINVNLATPGEVRISITAATPLQGAGPLAFVNFNVLALAGSTTPIGLTQADVNGGAISSCHAGNTLSICGDQPGEVVGVTVSGKTNTEIAWPRLAELAPTRYDVCSGTMLELRGDRSIIAATCVDNDTANPTAHDTRANPASGNGYYYLVRAQATCGRGSYGSTSSGQRRWTVAACP